MNQYTDTNGGHQLSGTSNRTKDGSLPALVFTVGFFVYLAVDATGTTQYALLYTATAMVIVAVSPFVVAVFLDHTGVRQRQPDLRAEAANLETSIQEVRNLLSLMSQPQPGKTEEAPPVGEESETLTQQVARLVAERQDNGNG